MSEPIQVRKMEYVVPVNVLERDESGQATSVQCPCCHEPARVGNDGRVLCNLQKAMLALLEEAYPDE